LIAFGIIERSGGKPNVDFVTNPVEGYLYCGYRGSYGAYMVSGTGVQLSTVAGLANVYPIGVVQRDSQEEDLDKAITEARRAKLNALLESFSLPTIPEGTTVRQVIRAVFRRFHDTWEADAIRFALKDTAD